jgi:hypothetical protein
MTNPPGTQVEAGGMARSAVARLDSIDFLDSPAEFGLEIARIDRAHPYSSLRSDLDSVVDYATAAD